MRRVLSFLLLFIAMLASSAAIAQLCKVADGALPANVDQVFAVGSDGDQFVIVADDQSFYTSIDGVNWTSQFTRSGLASTYDLKWTGQEFVGMAGRAIYTSPNGVDWDSETPNDDFNVVGVAWDGAQTVVTGNFNNGKNLSSRPDGGDWAPIDYDSMGSLDELVWTGDLFVTGQQGGVVLTSPDGLTWTERELETPVKPGGVASDGTLIMVMVSSNPYLSTDGIDWIEGDNVGFLVTELIWDGQFIAGGIDFSTDEAAVAVSDDGFDWVARTTGVAESQIREIASTGDKILAVTQRRMQNGPPNRLIELGSDCAELPVFANGFEG